MREKLLEIARFPRLGGITPACAGKTDSFRLSTTIVSGSPPRVREKLSLKIPKLTLDGITPACAGKTQETKSPNLYCKDHPRVCGKNARRSKSTITQLGSPPRVREKPVRRPCPNGCVGITPACAGKTNYLFYQ